ncbi:hypothetical protein ACIBEA_30055 [Streptomyces sp. NPDC051555]|uniref:hypothetical protein n=1 Tax=Streptomyces sp. NPDC051555 TaxID=3365657 RepID=UPI0037927D25
MPWFKIDDSAHSHPKFMRAGNAALGLWLRCGSYSAQHLLEGFIPKSVVKPFGGTPAQVRKLLEAGLWHDAGHDCKRCPQPTDGYMIHDYFEGGRNITKAQHEANKKGAADRAAKSRAARNANDSEPKQNNIQYATSSQMSSDRARNEPHFEDSTAGQEGLSQRTSAEPRATPHATTTPVPPTSFGSRGAAASGTTPNPLAYDTLADLKQAISQAGINGVSWNLQASQIERVRQVRERVGIPAMVAMAVGNARYRGAPSRASAWIGDWEGLEPEREPVDGVAYLPAARGIASPVGRQQQDTDAQFDRAMARAQARMQQESS